MGELVVDMFVSLDGVIQAPGGPDEDLDAGFEQGGWQVHYLDEEAGKVITEHMMRANALLLGRKTYELFAAYWPKAPADDPVAVQLNRLPKYVASRSLDRVEWTNSKLAGDDLDEAVGLMKQDHEQIHTIGSANLVQTLLQHDLVDRLTLWIYPIVLGSGKRLFGDGILPTALRLIESSTDANGTIVATYQRLGRTTYGTVGWDTDPPA